MKITITLNRVFAGGRGHNAYYNIEPPDTKNKFKLKYWGGTDWWSINR